MPKRRGLVALAAAALWLLSGAVAEKDKHLVYTTVGADADYIKLVKWLVLSINHCSRQPNFEFLVICDAASKPIAEEVISAGRLKFKVDYLVVDPAVTDKPGEQPAVAASARKLDIWRYPRIKEFINILFLDADYEVTLDLSHFIATQLQPEILYTSHEQRVVLTSKPEDRRTMWNWQEWGFGNYTAAEMETFNQHNLTVFSGGSFMFRNTPQMLQEFRDLKETMKTFTGRYFYEQSFLNYHFTTKLRTNNTVLSPVLLEWWAVIHAVGRHSMNNKLLHFTFAGTGAQRNVLMQRFYIHEVLQRHHAKLSVVHAWLETVSAFALESLPAADRANWFPNMGHIGQVPREVDRYFTLAAKQGVQTICEVGFNAGHSAAVFLAANPYARVYMFDFMGLPYSNRSMNLFATLFPKKFHYVAGSSFDTVPWLHKTRPDIQCDLFSVDGDHGYEGALTDFLNAHAMVPLGGTIVADDVSDRFNGCKQAWQRFVTAGYLTDVQCEAPEDLDANAAGTGVKGWCWGTTAKPTKVLTVPIAAKDGKFSLQPAP